MFQRSLVCIGLCLTTLFLVGNLSDPATAQNKDNKKDSAREAQLERQLKAAQNEANQLEKQVANLKQVLNRLEQENNKLEGQVKNLNNALLKEKREDVKDNARETMLERQVKALQQDLHKLENRNKELTVALAREKKDDKGDDARNKTLQHVIDGYRNAGLIHVILLHSKSDTPRNAAQAVIDDAHNQLARIPSVRGVWAGSPASRATPSASTAYSVALTLVFDDAAGLKRYLDDPIHKQFVEKHLKKWDTPVIYDFEPKK